MQEILGLASVLLTLLAYLPYLKKTIKDEIQPHPFTWIIWIITNSVVFYAQYISGAGPGAWMSAFVAILCIVIAGFSIKNGFSDITRLDKWAFGVAIGSIGLWVILDNPLYSVIVLTIINALSFIPLFRRAKNHPYSDALFFYVIAAIRQVLSIAAMDVVSITTSLFPYSIIGLTVSYSIYNFYRRRHCKND